LPFGQIYFDDLSSGDYIVNASKAGYQNSSVSILVDNDWQILEIELNPQ
jgi:hypothetical protein